MAKHSAKKSSDAKSKRPSAVFWFRRDLRLDDNAGLYHALKENQSVLPVFVFDTEILKHLPKDDARVTFIHDVILDLQKKLRKFGSDLLVLHGKPDEVFKKLIQQNDVEKIYCNHDYEPSARSRDEKIEKLAQSKGISFLSFKDQTLFEKEEILTDALKPYTVYTPYKNKVLKSLSGFYLSSYPTLSYKENFKKFKTPVVPSLQKLGFKKSTQKVPPARFPEKIISEYAKHRDFPALAGTTRLGLHLRFGTLSVRELARKAKPLSSVWLSELIWRDFFMQILWHFPHVEKKSFRPQYDKIAWRKSKKDFAKWCEGKTGYPLVDAGMRELNATGFMHNRVRMVTASFLCKHLLIHWYEGERYFAEKLLDYDLAANNGNWQWAAGSGCDAAPYFRIFNPSSQAQKFDKDEEYIRKWVPEFGTAAYPAPMVEHEMARARCLRAFQKALKG